MRRAGSRTLLVAEILSAYVRVRWLLRRHDLRTAVRILRAPPGAPLAGDDRNGTETGLRLGRAVGRVLEHLPVDDRCLVRALVLTRLLSARGLESSVVIGVTAEPEFAAHAWLERGGTALLPPNRARFERLVTL